MRLLFFSLAFMISPFIQAEEGSEFSQSQADFHSGFYETAAPHLEALLKAENGSRLALIRSQLAYAYLQLNKSKDVIQLFNNQNLQTDDFYLLGAALNLEKRTQEAIHMLESYLKQPTSTLRFQDAAQLELGLALLSNQQEEAAEGRLLSVSFDPDRPDLFACARLQCAKLAFLKGNRGLAEERLQGIESLIPADHPLKHEYAYLRGELLLQMQDYNEAISWLEKALPKRNSEKAGWTPNTLYSLGIAYLNSDGDPSINLEKSEYYLLKLQQIAPTEKTKLALGKCYLCKAKLLADQDALKKAKQILYDQKFLTPEYQAQALLLWADALPNDEAKLIVEQAIPWMQKSKDLNDIYYLYGSQAIRLKLNDPRYPLPDILQANLKNSNLLTPAYLLLLGKYFRDAGNHSSAEESFLNLAKDYSKSAHAAEGWYLASIEAQELEKDPDTILGYRRYVYDLYPKSPFAPEAYFNSFTYREYLQGDKKAMHHLQGMENYFPKSPYLLNGYYLLGLDYLRDRKTPEGRWIRKKSLTTAIDYFQRCEALYKELKENGQISKDALPYYTYLCRRAILERGLANYTMAEESSGAKREIYLDYASNVFQKLRSDLNTQPDQQLLDETEYGLAQAYLKAGKENDAETLLNGMLDRLKQQGSNKGYYISRVWYEKGLLEVKRGNYENAIGDFTLADEAGKGGFLSADQQLDNWIQISLCYRTLGKLDQAMLTLSKVINENVISGLRIKAMFLRAEIYEAQGRTDLARKQLESTSKKGGEWAVMAKDKLKQEYYYD